jgi:hypothetical protein
MIRRIVAFALWAYFGWYATAYVLLLFGIPTTLAPLGAAVMIVIAGVEWRSLGRRTSTAAASDTLPHQRTS